MFTKLVRDHSMRIDAVCSDAWCIQHTYEHNEIIRTRCARACANSETNKNTHAVWCAKGMCVCACVFSAARMRFEKRCDKV